jgi:NADP-dependent 3-hydroxy acid dehydrogenase YdfG
MGEENILITGSASGMGLAIAQKLGQKGRRVLCLDIDENALIQSCKKLNETSDALYEPIVCDLGNTTKLLESFHELPELQHLVHCAGIALPDHWSITSDKDWDELLRINLVAACLVIQQGAKILSAHRGGNIISISSTAAIKPMPSQAVYSAAKAGLNALHKALREEFRPHNIRLTTINPGPTKTNILRRFSEDYLEEFKVLEEPRLAASDIAAIVDFVIASPSHISFDDITLTPSAWAWN